MKSLFLVGAKLLGVYFLISGTIQIFALANFSRMNPFAGQIAMACLIEMLAGTALAFFSEFVAKAVRIPDYEEERPAISVRNALEVGIILLALQQLPALLVHVSQHVNEYLSYARGGSPENLLGWDVLGLALCLAAMFFARRIAAFLYREREEPPVA